MIDPRTEIGKDRMAGKYARLSAHLLEAARRGAKSVELSFRDVDELVGGLPDSARNHRPWWANSSQGQALAWRDAGWRVEFVSLDRERVRFELGGRGGSYADRGRVPAGTAEHVARAPAKPSRADGATAAGRIVLVGCVKQKGRSPAPARDLYTSPTFAARRRYAVGSGAPWFVVSSKWGVVDPDEVLAPYDMYLGDQPASYREAWGRFVVEQLRVRGLLRVGTVVEIHAGATYIAPLEEPLLAAGARIEAPLRGLDRAAALRWYASAVPDESPRAELGAQPLSEIVADAVAALFNAALADKAQLASNPALDRPGLYSWWVDAEGAAELSAGAAHQVRAGLIYAGQAGADRASPSPRGNTLRGRLFAMHFDGTIEFSTLRKSLHALLGRPSEAALSSWMAEHLRVAIWPTEDRATLGVVEAEVLAQLDPPLNLRGMLPSDLREQLKRLRAT